MDNTLRYERGNRGSIPFGGTRISRLSIMDNTVGFYPTNVGSIPAGEANFLWCL